MKRTKSPAGKTDDPVYAAIKAHRIAFAKMEVESREHNRWEEVELRKEKEGTELSSDERQELRAVEKRYHLASDREAEALHKLMNVAPISSAGAAALLGHIRDEIAAQPGALLFQPDDMIALLSNVQSAIGSRDA